MPRSAQFALDEKLIRSFKMVDGDLELVLKEIGKTSAPDEALHVCSFQMIHHSSSTEMGNLNLRIGYTPNIIHYRGNIGYTVFESFRGHGYSWRSCQLLVPLLRHLKLSPLWITCNVNNVPSRKSIEKLGATFVDTLEISDAYEFVQFYPTGARKKLRFRWDVS